MFHAWSAHAQSARDGRWSNLAHWKRFYDTLLEGEQLRSSTLEMIEEKRQSRLSVHLQAAKLSENDGSQQTLTPPPELLDSPASSAERFAIVGRD